MHNFYCHFVLDDENGTPERLYECCLKKILDKDDHNGLWLYLIMPEHTERRDYRTIAEFCEDENITMCHSLDYLISMINEAYGMNR